MSEAGDHHRPHFVGTNCSTFASVSRISLRVLSLNQGRHGKLHTVRPCNSQPRETEVSQYQE
mgnify:CR=1 FL=1